uniref:Secreted protein n=1 Tax=Haemonchus contortus TaxID=6289 RepID=A0A7I4Y838_HAECO
MNTRWSIFTICGCFHSPGPLARLIAPPVARTVEEAALVMGVAEDGPEQIARSVERPIVDYERCLLKVRFQAPVIRIWTKKKMARQWKIGEIRRRGNNAKRVPVMAGGISLCL